MESTLLGLVLDSSTVIRAERSKQSIPDFIEAILKAHGRLDLSLSPVTVAELVTGSIAPRHRRLVSADGHTSKNWST
jgi:predicted nucleic acid-binding protein